MLDKLGFFNKIKKKVHLVRLRDMEKTLGIKSYRRDLKSPAVGY